MIANQSQIVKVVSLNSLGAPEFCRIFDPLRAEYTSRTDTSLYSLFHLLMYGVAPCR